ncbi:uncharacterized protein E5676_scaffold1623G00160 [Cucumis melo var. makuwa]|uniref:Senescence-specific cysteine protease sag39 n=1 Tax=Cucumis melo var. makuwa TaxID=1194695 RepID=A0A5D3CSP4_CUCMM|nr:uncharacterized protein E5676_scaffold1623G00160 [Cucumis melo var. makuwa]
MSLANPSGKAQKDRLVELEEQMLYLVEVPNSIRYLESHVEEIFEKTDTIDAVAGRVEGLPIQKLLVRVDTLEVNVRRIEDFRATLDVVRNEITDVNTRLNLTMRAMANQVQVGGAVLVPKVKDANALENFIFDLE